MKTTPSGDATPSIPTCGVPKLAPGFRKPNPQNSLTHGTVRSHGFKLSTSKVTIVVEGRRWRVTCEAHQPLLQSPQNSPQAKGVTGLLCPGMGFRAQAHTLLAPRQCWGPHRPSYSCACRKVCANSLGGQEDPAQQCPLPSANHASTHPHHPI